MQNQRVLEWTPHFNIIVNSIIGPGHCIELFAIASGLSLADLVAKTKAIIVEHRKSLIRDLKSRGNFRERGQQQSPVQQPAASGRH